MQVFSNPGGVSLRFMRDNDRRRLLQTYLDRDLAGDRARLIRKSGLTHGRISQLLDPAHSFGERAAASLAAKLGLPAGYFEQALPTDITDDPATWPFELISRQQWQQLTERQRGAVEAAAVRAMRELPAPVTGPPDPRPDNSTSH